MNQIEKFLKKLDKTSAHTVLQLLKELKSGTVQKGTLKKLKGFKDLYRIRKGKIRIVVQKNEMGFIPITIEYRSKVYKNL